MSLLFTGAGDQLLGYKYISKVRSWYCNSLETELSILSEPSLQIQLLIQQSIKQGKLFDSEVGAYVRQFGPIWLLRLQMCTTSK